MTSDPELLERLGDAHAHIAELKSGPGRDILVFGSCCTGTSPCEPKPPSWPTTATPPTISLPPARSSPGTPIATAILDRAAALLDDDHKRLLAAATVFETAGCPYQRARTLILAGGDSASTGNAALADLGVTPVTATG